MARTKGSKNKKSLQFDMLCDELERTFKIGPIEALYLIINKRYKVEYKIRAAEVLLQYRYPKPVAEAVMKDQGDLFTLVRADGQPVAG